MLEVRDIHTYYGDSYVLQGVSLQAEQGRVVAVLGRNGMGKTTLMRSIIGFTPPRRGQLWFKGVDITGLPPYRIARMGMGIIPHSGIPGTPTGPGCAGWPGGSASVRHTVAGPAAASSRSSCCAGWTASSRCRPARAPRRWRSSAA